MDVALGERGGGGRFVVGLDDLRVFFQPLPFCDSVILNHEEPC